MQKRNATVAVIGAGDFIGGEIAKKFASEGFTVFAGRRNGDKLEPLVKEIEKAGGRSPRPLARRAQGRGDHLLPRRCRQACPAGSLHLQYRRQRQFPDSRHDRAGVPQSLGDGLLFRLPGRPRSGAADAAARQGQYLLHRRDGELARRDRLCGLRQRQVRPARRCAGDRARTRPEEHPRRPSDHRFRRRYRMGAAAAASRRWGRARSTIPIS